METQQIVDYWFKTAGVLKFEFGTVKRGPARGQRLIWCNRRSGKFLHETHLREMAAKLSERGLSVRQLNAEIQRVAPGRPCTHRKMREIYERFHAAH
ncbi:hypothetical protein ACFSHT_10215 [Paraburkholderia silviterrae]|uniref:Uncharacterized protein n=1 Tax=Paraburkholderia silviterrae TaxID=2528715 RepID=A0A4R5MEY3_9BURK|nr:hypothetical protein [Paraburkholderia silviterrae]TDG25333.1 hypothetical protein EYW47_05705 [Paraburkholderia silviterrae]